jgi:peptide/nickel transport system substrate-binding protein
MLPYSTPENVYGKVIAYCCSLKRRRKMKKNRWYLFITLLLALGFVLAACGGGAVEEAGETAEQVAQEAAELVEEIATEAEQVAEEVMAEFEPMSVAAENCDYGGKISSIEAVDELTVRFNLCKPDPAFLAKIAFVPFGIQPMEWLQATGGTGELLERPIGTGPYKVDQWVRGDQIRFSRFDDYWGDPAPSETAVLRWNQEGAARLVELQSGTVDYITNVSPDDYGAVEANSDLVLLPDLNPNILYLGMTNTFEPWSDVQVRQALAMGIDRQRIVDNFFPEGSQVADYFTPCTIPNGCAGEAWYDFNPEMANEMLDAAGFPRDANGVRFTTSIYYRDVFRVYLPEPGVVAVEFQTQLRDNLGIEAQVVVMESGEFIAQSTDGRLEGLYLLGWGADYPHVTNFLDFHFGAQNPQFGDPHPEIYEILKQASQIADEAEAQRLYTEANNAIRDLVPMIPIAHGASANAALASLQNAYVPPFGAPQFYKMNSGKDTLVFMQNNEPISLFCADETDGESLQPCQQVLESLLEYADDSGETLPELATACVGNEDATVWTCTLREGVLFHDGSKLDANDVVFTWAVGIDAANPLHVGNTGGFDYYSYLWDGLMNAGE